MKGPERCASYVVGTREDGLERGGGQMGEVISPFHIRFPPIPSLLLQPSDHLRMCNNTVLE